MQKMTLKMLRVSNGLNQKEAAKLVGVSADTWGHWERCQTEPSISMAYRIATTFNTNLDDIIFLPKVAVLPQQTFISRLERIWHERDFRTHSKKP